MALNERLPFAYPIRWTVALFFLVSLASSQTTSVPSAAKECNNACDSQYTSAYTTALQTSSIATFLLGQGNSTKRAADQACRLLADVSTCYTTCDTRFPASPSSTVYSKASEAQALKLQFCLTPNDGTSCRLMDSYYCEALYNKRSCGTTLENFMNCVVDTQLKSNNCSLNDAATWSQRNVLWYIATAVQYCAVSTKAVGDAVAGLTDPNEARKLQACQSIVTKICFGDFTSSGTHSSFADRYVDNDISCSVFPKAELCLWRTLNGTVTYNGQSVSAACNNLPDNVTAITSLVKELGRLTPKKCLTHDGSTGPRGSSTTAATPTKLSNAGATIITTSSAGDQRPLPYESTQQTSISGRLVSIARSTVGLQRLPTHSSVKPTFPMVSLNFEPLPSSGHLQLPSKASVLITTVVYAALLTQSYYHLHMLSDQRCYKI